MRREARAFWLRELGVGEIRPVSLPTLAPDEVLVRAVRSGISRGTERLVFDGRVPAGQYGVMRAPFQDGDFPGPVKSGYLSVGVVADGPADLCGRTVFCLHPHQTAYVVPRSAVTVVPDGVPPQRAVWIPAGVTHQVRMLGVSTRSAYIEPGAARADRTVCEVIEVSALMRELLLEAVDMPAEFFIEPG